MDINSMLQRISVIIDSSPANASRDPEACTWGRLAKVAEESGEVISAWIGVTGQNPRKGAYANRNDVIEELYDVALTALAAVEHMLDPCSTGDLMTQFERHVASRLTRLEICD